MNYILFLNDWTRLREEFLLLPLSKCLQLILPNRYFKRCQLRQ